MKNLPELSEFSKVTGDKINILKSTEFLYAINEQGGTDIKITIPFIVVFLLKKIIRCTLGIALLGIYPREMKTCS